MREREGSGFRGDYRIFEMLASNAIAVARMVAVAAATGGGSGGASAGRGGVIALGADIPFCSIWWFVYAGISCVVVLFAGIMSGLTLGLMSLGLVELEILQRSGTPTEKRQAGAFTNFFSSCTFLSIPTRDVLRVRSLTC